MIFLKDKKILVVDDEEGIRDLVVSELEFNGAKCIQASNGQEAFDQFKSQKFDAVISDIRMPDGDGLFFLEKIRENNIEPCTMIFMTGYSDVPLEEFYDRGVEAIIAKPFRLEQLVSTLELAMLSPRMAWRRAPRVVAILNIELNWAGLAEPIRTRTFNVGRGGMFIQTSKVMPKVGSRVKFTLCYHQEGREEILPGEMIVRWTRAESGEGVPRGFGGEFADLLQEQMDEIASVAGLVRTRVYIPKK
jgi:CheY-like chemotaxis protein